MSGLKARLLGIVLIGAGLALAWYFGLGPLREAQAGATEVSYSVKLFVVAPMAVLSGLVLLVGGASVADAITHPPRTRRQHLIVWPLFAASLAVGGLAYWWFDAQLHALGYVTG
jgi:hypothetical protein